ncbi:MAG: ABC transporter substrate-binding protein [Salinibacterium sp.]|nr:ABC transporter substrate-binding protein [Salinibacterium sp.]
MHRPSSSPASLASLVAAIVILSLSACSTPPAEPVVRPSVSIDSRVPLAELKFLDDPASWQGESTAILAEGSITGTRPIQSLPATVTSRDLAGDVSVMVTSTERILPMDISGSIAATVFGLGFGDRVVGRDVSTTFKEAVDLPVVTSSGHTVNSEAILALRPTVVITDGTIGPIDVVLQLRDAGIPIVFVDTEPSIGGVGELARQVSQALGAPAAGEAFAVELVAGIEAKVAEIGGLVASKKPLRMVFLYLRGSSGIYYLFGESSGADVLVRALGGVDVAAEIGLEEMRPMTDEAMVAANPDLILVMTGGLESVGGVDGLLEAKPAIALTSAGQHRRFVDMADGELLSFGPRTADVLDALARAIYAPGR